MRFAQWVTRSCVAVVVGLAITSGWAQLASAQTKDAATSPAAATAPAPTAPAPTAPTPQPPATASAIEDPYVIGWGDTLYISVWKEPDLTATIPVRPDGKISVPLLNDVQAAGFTPMQLAASLTERLKKYLADPRVTVIVTQANSQRIFVLGEVQHTGPMTLLPNMTVLQALSGAGFSQFANTKKIYVLRNEGGKEKKFPFNYKQALKGSVAQNIVLQPGDTIVVP